ncbi:MAG: cyclopropane-fatty-acyl-phospholipid synthase [Planctomycetota bacterium]|nr:cyclopropane-fatty-acyl-phospholipid synthase [Planctomycetota bacterium]MDA0932146.1 cyclopropane-fatty-acyl-phospholipid synthase [Planctomycetota bacterium]MDA1220400.1 cyclopropane-fatty-acyl-phospholipid synthase [Planctomycetota bacterium]
MSTTHHLLAPADAARPFTRTGLRTRIARNLVLRQLRGLAYGRLVLEDVFDGSVHSFGDPAEFPVRATVRVLDPDFYAAMAARGSIGVAEAWMTGAWTCDDLTSVVRIMVRNREVLEGMEGGLARLFQPLLKLLHARNSNTRIGSRRNIAAHYDLGNAFFAEFLDPTLTYSCGVFESEDATMEEASIAKIDRLCRKLDLKPSDHLVEIGTGWGAFAVHAAREYGCRVTTTTISKEQHAVAAERIREAGLEDRVTLLLEDYRDLTGQFDKLVSVEMIEAVGHQFLPTYLQKCASLLKPDGMAAIQAILIADQRYEAALREVDFIKRYIFPGSFIPSTTAIVDAATKNTDLRLHHMEEIGAHYTTTLRKWREAMYENLGKIRAQGYSEEFLRMWEYYLCYCEGGFAERFLGVGQYLFTKPWAKPEPLLPARSALRARA